MILTFKNASRIEDSSHNLMSKGKYRVQVKRFNYISEGKYKSDKLHVKCLINFVGEKAVATGCGQASLFAVLPSLIMTLTISLVL